MIILVLLDGIAFMLCGADGTEIRDGFFIILVTVFCFFRFILNGVNQAEITIEYKRKL